MRFVPVLAVTVIVLGPVAAGQADNAKIKQLLQERLATLKEVVKVATQDYQAGKVSFDRVSKATNDLLNAELELCQTDKERIAVFEKLVATAKDNETSAKARFKAGVALQSDVLLATASRLDAEIALERAKSKASKK